jgi:hypothetical protein
MITNRFITAGVFLSLMQLAAMTFAAAPDPIRDGLEKAKATRADDRAKARTALVSSIDALIKSAGAAGDLDRLKTLTAQKDALVGNGVLPNLPSLKEPVAQYTLTLRKADGELVAAYEVAIQAYSDAQKSAEADTLRKERQQLLSSGPTALDSPEAFALVLDRAKADYQSAINDGRKAYVQVIAARVESATRTGDLNAVTRFKVAQSAAEADQPLPEGLNDATIIGARVRFNNTIQTANLKLAQTYRDTIRGLTRGNRIDQATAVQAEFDATGLNGAAAGNTGARTTGGGVTADNNNNLARTLPAYLAATGTFGVEKEGGIKLADNCTISTNAADYLSKDFIFDVTVAVPKENHGITVGIGDFSHKGSLRITIYEDGGWGRLAHLAIGEEWGKKLGKVHVGETIVVRIERHDGPITASVGSITQGKFVAEMSQTVADPKKAMPEMSERRAKLFFSGGARFTRVRLATGAAAKTDAVADASATSGPGMGIVKIGSGNGAAVGPAATPVVNDPTKGYYKLNTVKLPPGFTASDTFNVTAAGLVPSEHCKIVTTAEDYFAKDFRFDVALQVPPNVGWLEVGVGDTTQEGSFRFSIRQDHGDRAFAALCQGDQWGKEVGKIRGVGEQYILRIEHLGPTLTFSAGQMRNGVFEAETSQTISNPPKAAKGFSERRAKLYFTGPTTWVSMQLLTGPAATAAMTSSNVPATPAVLVPKPPVALPAIGTTTTPKVNSPAVPPPVTPAAQNTNPAGTAPAIAGNPPAGAAAIPAKFPANSLVAVGTLETKKSPIGKDIPGRLVFTAPNHDKSWKGANGLAIPAGASWEKTGTAWICEDLRFKPRGATFIHPFGEGHVQIHIGEDGVAMSNNGIWNTYKEFVRQPIMPSSKIKFPVDKDKKYSARSELLPDGTCKIYIDGELVVTTHVTTAKPLQFGDAYKGVDLPATLKKGYAAVIVDQGFRFNSVAGELSFYPAK